MFCPGFVVLFFLSFLVLQLSCLDRKGWLIRFNCVLPFVCVCVFLHMFLCLPHGAMGLSEDRAYFKNSEYDQEIPQPQTADNPVAPQGRAAQPSRDTRKTN